MKPPYKELSSHLGGLFVCTPHDVYVRIRTPFLYPDGDVIDLYYDEQTGTLTDLAETSRWLRMQTVSLRRSVKQRQLIEDVCLNHGVEMVNGMLIMRLSREVSFLESLMRLCQAVIRVGDLCFTMRTRFVESIADEVADFLTSKEIEFERSKKYTGRSGRGWIVDFHTKTEQQSAFVYVLSTGSRASGRGITEHVLASWYDLSHLKTESEGLLFVSLFDDTVDVWVEEDFKLLDSLSKIARWSRPDEFEGILKKVE